MLVKNLLYKNNGDGTFTEVGEETGTNLSMDAMSTTIGDYNNDGWLDIYVSNTLAGNVFLKNTLLGGNLGLGLDMGITYHITPQLQFSGSILDLGFITSS